MEKRDLVNGRHVVELRNGIRGLIVEYSIMGQEYWCSLVNFQDTLEYWNVDERVIIKVFDFISFANGLDSILKDENLKLIWERKPELSEAERVILENLDKKYKHIARDQDGEIKVFKDSVWRMRDFWDGKERGCVLPFFNNLFQMVQWEDKEPTLISDLLGGQNEQSR